MSEELPSSTSPAQPPISSTSTSPQRKWGGGEVWLGLIFNFLVAPGLLFTYASLSEKLGLPEGLDVMVGIVILWGGWIGIPIYACKAKGSGSLAQDFGLRFERKDVFLGIGVAVLGQLAVFVVFLPIQILFPDLAKDLSDPAEDLANSATGLWVIPLYLGICIGAPFAEELFFRGLALRAFSYRFTPGFGIIASSVLFGVIHFEPLQTVGLVALGLVLGQAATRTGRLGPSIIGHSVFNTFSLVFLLN